MPVTRTDAQLESAVNQIWRVATIVILMIAVVCCAAIATALDATATMITAMAGGTGIIIGALELAGRGQSRK